MQVLYAGPLVYTGLFHYFYLSYGPVMCAFNTVSMNNSQLHIPSKPGRCARLPTCFWCSSRRQEERDDRGAVMPMLDANEYKFLRDGHMRLPGSKYRTR